MSTHIEWLSTQYTSVDHAARPGEFENDGSENAVAALRITGYDGDGVIIQGPPDDLVTLAEAILRAAQETLITTANYPELRSLYGRI